MSAPRNFQADAVEQGKWFEDYCRRVLQAAGFRITETHLDIPDAGVNVDFVAHNADDVAFYFTCKGSYRGRRPGARRTDTLKKAIAESYALHVHGFGPTLLLTSHLPETATGRALLASVDPGMLFDALDIHTANQRLQWLAQANEDQLRADLQQRQQVYVDRLARLERRAWGQRAVIRLPQCPSKAFARQKTLFDLQDVACSH